MQTNTISTRELSAALNALVIASDAVVDEIKTRGSASPGSAKEYRIACACAKSLLAAQQFPGTPPSAPR